MPLGIKPTVDFAFKKIFGTPENAAALLGLLNATLDWERSIEKVELLNPFSYQEFAESKQIVLDIRCRDSSGVWLNVEMQIAGTVGLVQRLVYYVCSMYTEQMERGGEYRTNCAAISICLLSRAWFVDTQKAHHRFSLTDKSSGRELPNAIEVHTVELAKYNLTEDTICNRSKIEQWAFLLMRAQDYEVEALLALLPGVEFEGAIRTLEVISQRTEDKRMYDQREKAHRDYLWALSGAREEGSNEGKKEGFERGYMAHEIRALQELLGDPVLSKEDFGSKGLEEMNSLLQNLEERRAAQRAQST